MAFNISVGRTLVVDVSILAMFGPSIALVLSSTKFLISLARSGLLWLCKISKISLILALLIFFGKDYSKGWTLLTDMLDGWSPLEELRKKDNWNSRIDERFGFLWR